ncbi:putative oxidoreductase ephD [Mycena venus]|uniref:Putative oxidoreductase ephD n=1 Tax=Mycena venus TaxID=2733690 RepID=A0A8H7CNV8_9AGAR|nr:putative oxidoreductase ephD [Mycena venus]
MLVSLKSLASSMALLPLVVANIQDIQTRDNSIERRFVDPVIAITPTDANFGISAVAPGRFVTSADGTKIFAEARGNPLKPAIVFIHGFGLGAMAFNEIFDDPLWLLQVYLVRYDTRGHGRSDKPTNAAAWVSQRLAEDFDAVRLILRISYPSTPPNYISGIIYDAAVPYMASIFNVGSPAAVATVPGLTTTTNVTQFQAAYIQFINLCHPALEWNFYLACLGDGVVQPRADAQFLFTRTQNSTGLLEAGTSGALPLLAIFGGNDKVVLKQASLDAIAGWKRLNVTTLANAEHFTWIGQQVLFRTTVLDWITLNVV